MFALTRQTDGNTSRFLSSVQHGPSESFGVMCAVGRDGSSSSENEADPFNIWNALLAAQVHYRVGEVLQPLLTEVDMGKVALSCHFTCDDPVHRCGNRRRCRPPATCGRRLAGVGEWAPGEVSQPRGCKLGAFSRTLGRLVSGRHSPTWSLLGCLSNARTVARE